jgi:hypothetical protein
MHRIVIDNLWISMVNNGLYKQRSRMKTGSKLMLVCIGMFTLILTNGIYGISGNQR